MGISYAKIIVQSVKNDLELLNFNLIVVKKILKIIKKISEKILKMIKFHRYKKFKTFFVKNNTTYSLIFYQKNIERHLRAIFIYCILRLEKIKTLYWNNKYKFTCFTIKNNFTYIEISFLQNYDKLLTYYACQIMTEINSSFVVNYNIFLKYINLKKNLLLIINTDNIKFYNKKIRYFLTKIGIEKLIAMGFKINIDQNL